VLKKGHFITSLTLLYIFAVDANHNNEGKVIFFLNFSMFSRQILLWDVTPLNCVGLFQHFGSICCPSLFEGDPTCRFCRKEAKTAQHVVCGCKALAR
jgi:hypothetical protein